MENNENNENIDNIDGINKLLFSYLNGKFTKDNLQKLKEWVESSDNNRRIFNETLNTWQGLYPPFNPEKINIKKAKKRLYVKIRKKLFIQMIHHWQRIAAILIIPLLLYSLYTITKMNKKVFTAVEYQEITVPYGTHSEMNLPDGSKVWLNSGSSLKYPVHFSSDSRKVQLRGEGFFEVKTNKQCPFIVKTGNMTLRATGTSFNIESYDADSITAVTLVEGVIDVAFNDETPRHINKGERISYNSITDKTAIQQPTDSNTDIYKWYSWKDGIMVLRNDPLSVVFKQLAQTYNVEFIIQDSTIADARYHATFHKESLSEILRLLEMTAPIQFKYKERISMSNVFEKQQIEVCWRKN